MSIFVVVILSFSKIVSGSKSNGNLVLEFEDFNHPSRTKRQDYVGIIWKWNQINSQWKWTCKNGKALNLYSKYVILKLD